ncbi:MAG: acetyl-CoA carboxylase biotin carboxyl carrier protein [Solirubrobacterales bacterium]
MTPETIKALLDAFERSDWREMVVTVGDDRLHVSRDPLPDAAMAPPAPAAPAAGPVTAGDPPPLPVAKASSGAVPPPVPPPAGAAVEVPEKGTKIESPSVGLFWRAPSPGAPPFVEVGGRVAAGETVAIVEVMKLMNHVSSPVDGVVTAILVENGGAVEFGQTIVVVDPEG